MGAVKTGDLVRARPVGTPETTVTGLVVGMSNASGRLTVAVETVAGNLHWCEAGTAVVLRTISAADASPHGGGDPETPPKEGGP